MQMSITVPTIYKEEIKSTLNAKGYKFTMDDFLSFRNELIFNIFYTYETKVKAHRDIISMEKKYNPKVYA